MTKLTGVPAAHRHNGRMKIFPLWHYRRWLPPRHPFLEDWAVPVLTGLYLAIFWLSLLWPDQAPERLLVGTLVSMAFVAATFRGLWHTDWGAYVYVAAMAALCYLTLPFTEAGIVFLFASIAFLAYVRHWKLSLLVQVTVTGLAAYQGYVLGFHGLFIVITVLLIVFGGTLDFLFHRYVDQQSMLLKSQDEAEHLARTAERERIARDLHDLLGHTLSGIRVKAELAGRLIGQKPEQATQEIADIEQLARSSLQQVRATVSGYHEGGIALEINAARSLLSAAGINFRPVTTEAVPARLESTLAFVLREGVTNIVRHAYATVVDLTLSRDDEVLTLSLLDNGVGLSGTPGNGMQGIRTRVRSEGGHVQWKSKNPGTRMQITLPVQEADYA